MPRLTGAQLHEEIIAVAARLFSEKGYAATSVQQVADEMGYSKSGLLHHFSSKQQLLAAVIREPLRKLDHLDKVAAQMPQGREREAFTTAALVEIVLEERAGIGVLLNEGVVPTDAFEERSEMAFLRQRLCNLFFPSPNLPFEAEVRINFAFAGLIDSVIRCGDIPVQEIRQPLLRAFRDSCGLVAPLPSFTEEEIRERLGFHG
ncbi:helix-turn-helix domain-containing protein [Streptomyces sp. NPDC051662]|uniref:TetR/AcrR family transcriptional regulator n=1 Tax=Streptomyces sp. NPDC051662 TaxID=3154750 RepID=UPI00343D9F98